MSIKPQYYAKYRHKNGLSGGLEGHGKRYETIVTAGLVTVQVGMVGVSA